MTLLNERKGSTFITIVTKTIPKLKKTGNPLYGKVEKIARRNLVVGVDYTNAVNNRREKESKEPDFEAAPLQWGKHYNNYLIEHNGKYYLKCRPKDCGSLEEFFRNTESREIIPPNQVEPFLPTRSQSRQGVDKVVPWVTIDLANILNLSMSGDNFELV